VAFLVILQKGERGHFVVIRPVGHSRKLIQVIDAASDPIIMDASDPYSSPEWTGLALIRQRSNWTNLSLASAFATFSSILFVLLFRSRFRGASSIKAMAIAAFRDRFRFWRQRG
jgi:hypothetical protein